ncbi:MAG: T9SS type A sorting domain-containing protein [Bacteroidota bacterium]|nr:T9SS type A sorting domain-containing protein [Bacteroidota bacterium]
MKWILIIFCSCMLINASAQVTFESENYPQPGDNFPLINYFNNPGDDPAFLSDFMDGNNFEIIDKDSLFVDYILDTVFYHNPQDYDTANIFPNATHLMIHGNAEIYIVKTDQQASTIGFAGDIFQMGINLPMPVDSPLQMMEFPTDTETAFSDYAESSNKMPVEDLEHVLPPDYYNNLETYFDSIKVTLSVDINTEVSGECQVTVENMPYAIGGTYDCLQENMRQIQEINVFGRLIITETWVALGEVMQLPMELPIIDTTHNINLWTPSFSYPFVQFETTASHDTVHNVNFHYSEDASIHHSMLSSLDVYPNPASEKVMINTGDFTNEIEYLCIVDESGKIVKKFAVNSKICTFATNDLPGGWYVINALNNNGAIIAKQKLMIIK